MHLKGLAVEHGALLGLNPDAALALLSPIIDAYGKEPQRKYHDARHLAEVLAEVWRLRARATDVAPVIFAAWFHDVIYDTARRDNEEASAALAVSALASHGITGDVATETHRIILTTKDHLASADPNAQVMADADCAVFAAAAPRYAEYARGVRAEYGVYGWSAYSLGRCRFLRKMLRVRDERGRLFFFADAEREHTAHRNLLRELSALSPLPLLVARLTRHDPYARLDR